MQRTAFFALAGLFVAGCATPPDRISAASLPASAYAAHDCGALNSERAAVSASLASLSRAQTQAATTDTIGVLLIGVPLGSAGGGDKESEISLAKGKIAAIDSERLRKGCA